MESPLLELDLLRTLLLTSETGTFARAAEQLRLTQSAISLQMRRLEERSKGRLLRKEGRRLVPTEAGEILIAHARRVLALNDQALARIRGAEMAGSVRLGLAQDFAETWLPAVLARFGQSYPQVQIEVCADRRAVLGRKLEEGQLDLILLFEETSAGLGKPLTRLPISWIASPEFVRRPGEPLPLIVFESPCLFRQRAIDALDQRGLSWRIAFTSASLAGLWAAAIAGLGITVRTPEGMPGSLRRLPAGRALPALGEIGLYLRARAALSPAAERLRAILFETIAQRVVH